MNPETDMTTDHEAEVRAKTKQRHNLRDRLLRLSTRMGKMDVESIAAMHAHLDAFRDEQRARREAGKEVRG